MEEKKTIKMKLSTIILLIIIFILIIAIAIVYYLGFVKSNKKHAEKVEELNKKIISLQLEIEKDNLITESQEASDNTREEQIKEALSLAKAEIIADYYMNSTQIPDEKTIELKIKEYLGDNWQVKANGSNNGIYYFNFVDPKGNKIEKNFELDLTRNI